MEINRHIKKYGSRTDERSEIASGDLKKPYVAYIEDEDIIDWNTQEAKKDYRKEYFTIVVNEPGVLKVTSNSGRQMEYSVDGTNWVAFDEAALNLPITGDFFPLKIHFKGINPTLHNFQPTTITYWNISEDAQQTFSAEGNTMSLLYGEDFADKTVFPDGSMNTLRALFGNSRIVSVENLVMPATTLTTRCYNQMFQNCKDLTTAPALPVTDLVLECYSQMFQNCSNLRRVTCLAEDLSAQSALLYWLRNVSPSGTFVKKAGVDWPTGVSGIPDGWTVEEV